MTRTPLSRSKGQISRSSGRFTQRGLNAVIKAAAADSVGAYSPWESTATLRLLGGARAAAARPRGGEEMGGGHIVWPRAQLVIVAYVRVRETIHRFYRLQLPAKHRLFVLFPLYNLVTVVAVV